MTVRECYEKMGADFEGVLGRLGSESLITRFVKKFPADKSMASFEEALASKNYEEAFRAIHTLKGVSANLSLSRLFEISSAMTEDIRGGVEPSRPELIERVREEYAKTVALIAEIE